MKQTPLGVCSSKGCFIFSREMKKIVLILLALGLLLLWLFVWLIGGAIVGLIHGAISLGGKWCYKEVAA